MEGSLKLQNFVMPAQTAFDQSSCPTCKMGIPGLTSFIKKQAGHTFKTVRLHELHGRRVAIDANVLTLKFHHSNESAHPNRTIFGWYRCIRNLQSYGIKPIVVFDGRSRVSAKARELQKRHMARRLLGGRAKSEEARIERLTGLKEVVGQLLELPAQARHSTLNETEKIIKDSATSLAEPDIITRQVQDVSLPLSTKFASLVLDMQTAKISQEGTLSKRQMAIAQDEAQAFTKAMSIQAEIARDEEEEEEEEEDPLAALEIILSESRGVASNYEKRATSVSAQTKTDCMVSTIRVRLEDFVARLTLDIGNAQINGRAPASNI